uniref:Uncharacterized protein n=1 Tax=Rhizophora mucronata TaxID=61149 RepID=A0A2P2IYB9_RHIMU
MQKPAAMFT